MDYYDTHTATLLTATQLSGRGFQVNDTETLKMTGIYPVTERKPELNPLLETLGQAELDYDAHTDSYTWTFAVVPLPMDIARAGLKPHVTARRWQAETGGITLPDGTHLLTTREDQAVITGAVTRAMLKPDTAIDFKTASGAWVSVDAARMIALGLAVSEHVEHCFSRERALHEAIDKAESVDVLNALDINTGWPGESPNTAPVPEEG